MGAPRTRKVALATVLAVVVALPVLAYLRSAVSGPVPFAWAYAGQQAWSDASKTAPMDLAALQEGQEAWLVVRARNVGSATWSNTGPNPLRLATTRPADRPSRFATETWIATNRPTALQESAVAPGQVGTFEFALRVPVGPGVFDEHFNLVAEGREWLEDNVGLYFRATVS